VLKEQKLKKTVYVAFVVIFTLIVAFINAPTLVQAAPDNSTSPSPKPDVWSTGTEVVIDLATYPAPPDQQLFGKGVVVDEPATLCHPFDMGRFGWTGTVYQLMEGQWIKLPTSVGWVPDEEGQYMACATTSSAGTFALFAYYTRPEVTGCQYNTSEWYGSYFNAENYPELYPGVEGYYLDAYVEGLPIGTKVTYRIISIDGYVIADPSSSTHAYLYDEEYIWADFMASSPLMWDGDWTIIMEISAAGCSKIVTVNSDD
jgi:hypothetical protein